MDRQTGIEGLGKTEYFSKALDFIDKADHLSYDKLCRRAVNNSEALIEILQQTEESVNFMASRQIDREVVAGQVKSILQRLHFNPSDDYYLALLLPRDAGVSMIHQRWKAMMLVYHPDRQSESTVSTAQHTADCARRLNEVFDVLKDPKKKFPYDQRLDHPSKDGLERPSFCTKPGKTAFSEMVRKNYFSAALLILLTTTALTASLYFMTIVPKVTSATGDPHSVYRDKTGSPNVAESVGGPVAYAPLPMNELPKQSFSARPDNQQAKRSTGLSLVKRNGSDSESVRMDSVLLAEEVYALINRLTQAYEKGDLDAYLSCYSQSAVEGDGMRYNDLKIYYRNLFKSGGHYLSIGNMIIRAGRESIIVKGAFDEDSLAKNAEPMATGGVEMTLEREDRKLKIKYFRRIAFPAIEAPAELHPAASVKDGV